MYSKYKFLCNVVTCYHSVPFFIVSLDPHPIIQSVIAYPRRDLGLSLQCAQAHLNLLIPMMTSPTGYQMTSSRQRRGILRDSLLMMTSHPGSLQPHQARPVNRPYSQIYGSTEDSNLRPRGT